MTREFRMTEENKELRSLALAPTWSVAFVLAIFVTVSVLVERSIHRLSYWLRKTNRKPLLEAVEKMKEELMLVGFISILLTATSNTISSICIKSKFYGGTFHTCTDSTQHHKLMKAPIPHHSLRRILNVLNQNPCNEGQEPFVSYEGLEQLHRFIFVMAITHISYSCLTMLLAIIKIHGWRKWEDEAHMDRHGAFTEIIREAVTRQSMFVKFHTANPLGRNRFLVWVTCFFRQFACSVDRVDYLALRVGFIKNHNLALKYDFHNYMVRSMEEEFQKIVGVSVPLWGFVISVMLFNVKGSNLYFWIAMIPITLVLLVGAKLQHIIATLAWENAGITGFFTGTKLRPRDDLFWFKKPELILSLIHFVLFQNAFELASFFWFWWQFGYNSCFIENHFLVYTRVILGFACQFLCSYSTLPQYALVTQMGTNYKAALISQSLRETIHGWKKAAKRKRGLGIVNEDSTIHTNTSTIHSHEECECQQYETPDTVTGTIHSHEECECPQYETPDAVTGTYGDIELQPASTITTSHVSLVPNENSSKVSTPLLRSISSCTTSMGLQERILRSSTMPIRRG